MAEQRDLDQQMFNQGANSDISPELIKTKEGIYVDSLNMRKSSTTGNALAREKIGGEIIVYDTYIYPSTPPATPLTKSLFIAGNSYVNLNFATVKGYLIAVWAKSGSPSLITINNMIVCEASTLGFTYNHPIQNDINESCVDGEIFYTDFNTTPYIFNIQDLLDNYNANLDTYFASFNPNLYVVNLTRQNDQPVFVKLENVGSSNGLDFGYYAYAYRYVDVTGNKTPIGTFSPLIPVIYNYNDNYLSNGGFTNYPTHLTRGADNSYNQNTKKYGIKLRYRVTNIGNYDHVEFIRIRWIGSPSISPTPSAEMTTIGISLTPGETSVYDFIDQTLNGLPGVVWEAMPPTEETQVLMAIECAKGIRYYDNRLVLMNIKYASKNLSTLNIQVPTVNAENQFPYIHNMGVLGHANPKNTTYYKGYKGGEKYGFGILAKDYNGERTFVLPITDALTGDDLFQFPNNREALSLNSKNVSAIDGKGVVYTATIHSYNNDINETKFTNEIINLRGGVTMPNKPLYFPKAKGSLHTTISIFKDDTFNPIHPTYQDDTNIQGHSESVTSMNFKACNSSDESLSDSEWAYGNYIFAPEIYAKGLAITAVTGLPNWVKSFSIVRTKPIGRVLTQGIGMYSFIDKMHGHKNLNKICFYSQDIDELNINILNATKLQFVSPLGFNSEVYSAFITVGMDMISYARLGYNASSIGNEPTNIGLTKSNGSTNYYTEFGAWRNSDALASNKFYDGTQIDGNKIFNIDSVVQRTEGRFAFYEITLAASTGNIYNYSNAPPLSANANDVTVQQFHEPFYLVNIINNGASMAQNNMTEYIETGHHQKIESIIGSGTNLPQKLQLCDERYEDCIPCKYSDNRTIITSFLFVRDKPTNSEQRWLNIKYLPTVLKNTIISDLNTNGVYVLPHLSIYPNPFNSQQDINVYGVYTSEWSDATDPLSDPDGRDAKIVFDYINNSTGTALSPQYCIPDAGTYVIIKYDIRFPLKVFGGDTIISEDTTCFVDGKNDRHGTDFVDHQNISTPFPYNGIAFDSGYKRIAKAQHASGNSGAEGGSSTFLDRHQYPIVYLRQLAVNFFHESKIPMPYEFNNPPVWDYVRNKNFPRIQYVMRPCEWTGNATSVGNFGNNGGSINEDYNNVNTNYPFEYSAGNGNSVNNWGYGGFMCNNFVGSGGAINNSDYRQSNNYLPATSRPIVGWHEVVDYCTRTIWSERRNIAQQNIPNLKTFLVASTYDIEDANGEIKMAWSAESSQGNNLYALCDSGIAILMTNKQFTSDPMGNGALTLTTPAFLNPLLSGGAHRWLSNKVGLTDEFWRTAAQYDKVLFFADRDSCFTLLDNKINDIGRLGYRKRLYYDGLQKILPSYESNVCAVFDRHHNEYWLCIGTSFVPENVSLLKINQGGTYYAYIRLGKNLTSPVNYQVNNGSWVNIADINPLVHMVFLQNTDFAVGEQVTITNSSGYDLDVFSTSFIPDYYILNSTNTQTYEFDGTHWILATKSNFNETFVACVDGDNISWNGTYSYNFEKLVCLDNIVYGIRQGVIYVLNSGTTINGSTVRSELISVDNHAQIYDKEFIAIAVNSNNIPTRIDFGRNVNTPIECSLYAGMSTPPNTYYLKNYGKWTNQIARMIAGNNDRLQSRYMVFNIIHEADESFVVVDTVVKSKIIKLQI